MSTSSETDAPIHELIIVGSGPAGYTAALYAARAELTPLVFEGSQFGGALMTTTEVENFPGFREGIQGPALMDEMREQALRFGADLRMEDVDAIRLAGDIKEVEVAGEVHRSRAIILAMGAAARYLGLDDEQRLLGRGVSSCATCDGFFFKDQAIAVIGGGDSAMEEATFLTKFASKVYLIHRREEFRASRIMLDRARANPKIEFMTDTAATGSGRLNLNLSIPLFTPEATEVKGRFTAEDNTLTFRPTALPALTAVRGTLDFTEQGASSSGIQLTALGGRSTLTLAPFRTGANQRPKLRFALNGTVDAKPEETYTAAARVLAKHDVAYLHIAEIGRAHV